VKVNLRYFHVPFAERLRTNGARFEKVRPLPCIRQMGIKSVAQEYHGGSRACARASSDGAPLLS
jgi:hypothetical protein